ncbi:MAG TPA: trigger factor [Ruminococcaceae bacterium]|nr:trigger factor [Oscillospiraceae bacterium]
MNLVSNKKLENNIVELEVSVGADQFKPAVDRAFKKNSAKISIPGFRKGKAPRAMIEKMYGQGIFFEDAVNELYSSAYQEAVEQAGLEPVDRPDIEITEVNSEGFSFKAKVTIKPEVEVSDYKGIKVTKNIYKVTDEDVDAEIKKLQERNSRVIAVEDRPAMRNDVANINFEGFVDGVAFDGGKGENYPLTLGSGSFIPGFEEQVIGHNAGEEFDVNVSFPEEYHVEELKGKPAVFKVKINSITSRELPTVDDEFAKDVSEFDTVAELRTDIAKKLEESKAKQADTEVEDKLIETVVANMKADIPQCMIENSIDRFVDDFAYRLQSQGLNIETYLKYTGTDMEAFRKTFAEQAENQVKIRLALEKIAQLENIAATSEDIEAEIEKLAESYKLDKEKVKSFIPEKEIAKDIAINKAIDFIRDNAKITEKAAKK